MELQNNGATRFNLRNTATSVDWRFNNTGTTLRIASDGNTEFEIDTAGNVTLDGTLTTGSLTNYPDYVFEDDYPLLSLSELAAYIEREGHLPNIASAGEVEENGGRVNMTELQIKLLEKVEELTLYTLQQQETIEALQAEVAALKEAAQE